MTKLVIIFSIVALICVTVLFVIRYIPRMRAWLYSFKKQERIYSAKMHKLALLIPARNESKVIKDLFNTINQQSYPKEFFDVHVLVKDESDPTIELTKNMVGGIAHVISSQTCKGDALEECLHQILNTDPDMYDAYIIVDADCMLDSEFLTEMNNALASGRQVIQAKKLVKNYLSDDKKANSLSSSCNGLIWTMIDDMGNRYKSDKGITNMIIGTGVMIRSDVIKQIGGWPYRQTLTEDIEMMYDCVLNDFSTFYYSYAKIYVEESTSLKVTNKRRTRWLTGVVDSKSIYIDRIKEKYKDNPSKRIKRNIYYTTALSPVYGYVGFLSVFTIAQILISVAMIVFQNQSWWIFGVLGLTSFLTLYLSFFVLTACCLIVDGKYMKINFFKKLAVLFCHPIFYMGYIPIIYRALRHKNCKGWEVIDRMDLEVSATEHKHN